MPAPTSPRSRRPTPSTSTPSPPTRASAVAASRARCSTPQRDSRPRAASRPSPSTPPPPTRARRRCTRARATPSRSASPRRAGYPGSWATSGLYEARQRHLPEVQAARLHLAEGVERHGQITLALVAADHLLALVGEQHAPRLLRVARDVVVADVQEVERAELRRADPGIAVEPRRLPGPAGRDVLAIRPVHRVLGPVLDRNDV